MKKLFLVRHGETNWNIEGRTQGWKDSNLTERGLKQAEALAKRLKEENIDVVFSSSLDRARRTAKIISKELEVLCYFKDELKEMRFGRWEGLTLDEIKDQFPQELDDWHYRPHICKIPDGEEIAFVQERMMVLFQELQNRPEENILLVSHGTVIKIFLMGFLNMPLTNYYRIAQYNCALNLIEFKSKGPVLSKYNDISYMRIALEGERNGE